MPQVLFGTPSSVERLDMLTMIIENMPLDGISTDTLSYRMQCVF